MDNKDKVNQILQDLFELDPGLRKHEGKLKQLITDLLAARPEVEIDEQFILQLRRKLLARADLMQNKKTSNNMNFMKKLNYIFGTATVVALVALVIVTNPSAREKLALNTNDQAALFAGDQQIKSVEKEAFGKLALEDLGARSQSGGGGGMGGDSAMSYMASPEISTTAPALPQPDPSMGSGGGNASSKMIAPDYIPTNYKFVYKGEEFTLEDSEADVYKRTKGLNAAVSASQILRRLNFGLVDLGTFSNTTVQSLNLVEDKEFGYNFYINLQDGVISINENWLRWPTPDKSCRDQACYESLRLNISDIPEDSKIIEVADKFLADHRISKTNLGTPFVQDFWREEYRIMADKSQFWVPDVISVVYPLKVNGQEVYDESGYKTGLNVSVNVRVMRVNGVYELSSQQYEASKYAAETSVDRVLKLAQQGNFRYGYFYQDPNARTVEVELGTPTKSLVKLWHYKQATGMSEELVVPALIFPVTKAPTDQPYYQKTVVIPLVKDILDSQPDVMPMPMPVDLPVTRPAVEPSISAEPLIAE